MKNKWISIMLCMMLILGLAPADPAGAAASDACTIRIVHTNDFHGYYKETSYGCIGFAKLKSLIASQEADLVLDVGDAFHGQSFATVEKGQGIAELMKSVGYDAMTPGNHDWSYGADRLKELGDMADTPILASNVVDSDGKEFFDTPYLVKEVTADDGTKLKVGVLGVIDDVFYGWTPSQNVEGLTFGEEAAKASETAKKLRDDEGCDLVLALTHQTDCEGFVKNIRGIDAVFAGHEHVLLDKSYPDAEGKSVPVVEAGYYFYDVGVLSLTLDTKNNAIQAKEEVFDAKNTTDMEADPAVFAEIAKAEERQKAVLEEVIGHSDEEYGYSWEEIRTGEQAVGRIVTAAYLARTGADVAFENDGGIRAGIKAGDIAYQDIIAISPYGNVIQTKQLTGRQILDVLEKSISVTLENAAANKKQMEAAAQGMTYDEYSKLYPFPVNSGNALQIGGMSVQYDPARDAGSRIVSAKIGGQPLDESKIYVAAMNNYVASCEDYPEIKDSALIKEFGTCEEALKDYIKKGEFSKAAGTPNLVETAGGTEVSPNPTAPAASTPGAGTVPGAVPTIAPTAVPTAAPTESPKTSSGGQKKTVKLAKTKVKKAELKKKKLTVNISKVKKADGYQIQAAANKKFTKGKKSWKTSKLTLKGKAWKKKSGYVRARAYGKDNGHTVYGSWSGVKKMKAGSKK